jgi:sialidase-1
MKNHQFVIVVSAMASLFACNQEEPNPFWGDGREFFDIRLIDSGYRAHSVNITTALDGTVLFGGGDRSYLRMVPLQEGVNIPLWRSEDGGETWLSDATYPISGAGSWGLHVDETTGDVLKFDTKFDFKRGCGERGTPPEEFVMWRSMDQGRTWTKEEIEQEKDINGWYSWAGGCETGITLQYGVNKGRLLRATRVFVEYQVGRGEFFGDHYSSAIYSDDQGKTWHASAPFPKASTGEAALVELSDGRIYYNSRDHNLRGNEKMFKSRFIAWSYDGGETWSDLEKCKYLPDGARDQEHGLMGGLVRLPLDNYDILIYSNIDSPSGRKNSTVWASFDGGRTWPVKRQVDEGGSAYSSLAAGREGTPSEGMIYLLKEGIGDNAHNGIKVARFNLAWLTQGRDWKEFILPAERIY